MLKYAHITRGRFFDFVDLFHGITDEDCWNWIGGKDWDGYGLFKYKKRTYRAPRFVLMLKNGEHPKGIVCHHCDNPSCVNPSHLFVGSFQDNNDDMVRKGRAKVKGSENGNSKLTEDQVLQIKNLLSTGLYTNYDLGAKFKVDYRTISTIRCGAFWKHVK